MLIDTGPELSWAELGRVNESAVLAAVGRAGMSSLGALDDKVFNPIGYRRRHSGEFTAMRPFAARPELLRYDAAGSSRTIDTRRGPSETDIALLRNAQGVEVNWKGGWGPQAYCRLVACLAMAGVPLVADAPPQWSRLLLGENLITALERRPALDDRS